MVILHVAVCFPDHLMRRINYAKTGLALTSLQIKDYFCIHPKVRTMKKTNYLKFLSFIFVTASSLTINAQCVTLSNLGSSANMLTKTKGNGNTVVADKDLNTVVFIHRNNPNSFGGSSGHLRYDLSTDGGATWTNNLGPVNPALTKQARYPNVTIYNPTGNTNPNNAYLGYLAPAINTSGGWSGVVSGVRQLSGTGNTESYSQPAATNQVVASLVKGAPGVFWATDYTFNGTQFTGGILIYKGVWTGSNISWTLKQQLNPSYNLSSTGNPRLGEASIAFDPTGMKGWMCVTAHLSSASTHFRYLPVFYKTTDGGNTWSGPILVDISQFSCISANLATTAGIFYANDLTVDIYGHPHLLITLGASDSNYGINNNQWHHMFDITQQHGVFTAYDIANVLAEVSTFFPGSNNSIVYQTTHPQVSRSADGTKVFFSWTDNSGYAQANPNMSPQFFARGFDAVQNKWTQARDFTSCNSTTSGWIFFPHMAAETLEPSPGVYKLAVVYSLLGNSDPDDVATFKFLDNATFSNQDFTISQPLLNPLSVSPGSFIPICAGNFVNLQVNGAFQNIAWSNGPTTVFNNVGNPGVYHVGVHQDCQVGWDSVIVQALSISLPSGTLSACAGVSQILTVNGNALGYTWTPGSMTGDSITVMPVSNTIYTIYAVGINTCNVSTTLNVIVNPAPIISATSNRSLICVGEEVILEATGADTYAWSSGDSTATTTVQPLTANNYTVTGYSSAGCPGTFTISQLVDPCTGIKEADRFANQLLVYPNPGKGMISIKTESDMQCTLSNELGQVLQVLKFSANNQRLVVLKELAPGIYFLKENTAEANLYRKIIIE